MGNACQRLRVLCGEIFFINKYNKDIRVKLNENNHSDSDFKSQDEKESKIIPYITQHRTSLQDFKLIKTLGKGSFGKVLLVRYIFDGKYYAMKIFNKANLIKQKQIQHTKVERKILEIVDHPFIVKLLFAFQTNERLYIVTEFMQGGELFYHLKREGCFSNERSKLYLCEIILAIEYLHNNGIIYRDLKPENILLDSNGHIKLTDFGLSKIFLPDEDGNPSPMRAFTICGTPEYLAPEILKGGGYDKSVDWWSLGALFYEMLTGESPFKFNMKNLDIKNYLKPIQKHSNIHPIAFSLITKLLEPNTSKRIKEAEEIKSHEYFKGINWNNVKNKKFKPLFKPYIKHSEDLSHFDKNFTEEDPISDKEKSLLMPIKEKSTENIFENFTYIHQEI